MPTHKGQISLPSLSQFPASSRTRVNSILCAISFAVLSPPLPSPPSLVDDPAKVPASFTRESDDSHDINTSATVNLDIFAASMLFPGGRSGGGGEARILSRENYAKSRHPADDSALGSRLHEEMNTKEIKRKGERPERA